MRLCDIHSYFTSSDMNAQATILLFEHYKFELLLSHIPGVIELIYKFGLTRFHFHSFIIEDGSAGRLTACTRCGGHWGMEQHLLTHDDVIKWKHFPRYLPFVWGEFTGEFPSQRQVTRSFDVFFDLRPNKRLSKTSKRRWFNTPSCSLWRHCNVNTLMNG